MLYIPQDSWMRDCIFWWMRLYFSTPKEHGLQHWATCNISEKLVLTQSSKSTFYHTSYKSIKTYNYIILIQYYTEWSLILENDWNPFLSSNICFHCYFRAHSGCFFFRCWSYPFNSAFGSGILKLCQSMYSWCIKWYPQKTISKLRCLDPDPELDPPDDIEVAKLGIRGRVYFSVRIRN